jgi:hypothetical protein
MGKKRCAQGGGRAYQLNEMPSVRHRTVTDPAPPAPLPAELGIWPLPVLAATLWRALPALAGFAGLPLLLTLVVPLFDLNAPLVFRDPVALARLPLEAGVFSYVGILAWWTGAVAALLAASLLPPGTPRAALLYGGWLTVMLALDDLFQLHEGLFPALGLPELAVQGGYAVAAAAYLLAFVRFHVRMDWPLLLAALCLLALSIFADVFLGGDRWRAVLAEDGTKFAGIIAWTAYHVMAARTLLRGRYSSL